MNADRTRIEQVVTNLVSNAVQHTATGGRIAVRVAALADAAELTVSDDGVGMDAETAARAFELFFQAQQGPGAQTRRSRHRAHAGAAHRRAARRRDRGCERRPGHGRDLHASLADDRGAAGERSVQRDAAVRRARRVVIVEDSEDARVSLQRILEREGHTVHTAADGPSGFDVIAQLQPDVALIDIGLPGLDGYRLAAAAALHRAAHVPDRADRLRSRRGPQPRARLGIRRAPDEAAADGSAARVGRVGLGLKRCRL